MESSKNLSFNRDHHHLLLQGVTNSRLEKIKNLQAQGIPLNQIVLIQAQGYPIFTETSDGLQVEDCFYVRQAKPEDRNLASPLLNGVLMRWEIRNPNTKCYKIEIRRGELRESEIVTTPVYGKGKFS